MSNSSTTSYSASEAFAQARARIKDRLQRQSFLMMIYWGWQMNNSFIIIYTMRSLGWPNETQAGGPGQYEWGRHYHRSVQK